MAKERTPTKERFLKDVENHKMTVELDQGAYRHLVFRQGSSNHWFEIVTYPHKLVLSGDMGTWVFSRIPDMFSFFRDKNNDINCSYWAEKLQNGTSGGSSECQVYDGDVYKASIIESLENYDLSDEHKALVIEALDDIDFFDEHWVISQIREFEVDLEDPEPYMSTYELAKQPYKSSRKREKFSFQDIWEIDMKVYSYHFIWCLYAIVWGINRYDEMKENSNG